MAVFLIRIKPWSKELFPDTLLQTVVLADELLLGDIEV